MAILELDFQRIVARIVYDGPGQAGKTTNAEALCRQFSPRRRSELYIPQTLGSRTLFFDWLYVDAGMLEGYPLRLQVVTVPGQIILDHRRAHLLRSADAVVFVCDSTRSRLQLVREKLDSLREHLCDRDVPILIQANKQDLEDALEIEELRKTLGLDAQTPIIRACASMGHGVLETLRAATQATATYLSAKIAAHGVESLAGNPGSGTELHEEMVALEDRDRREQLATSLGTTDDRSAEPKLPSAAASDATHKPAQSLSPPESGPSNQPPQPSQGSRSEFRATPKSSKSSAPDQPPPQPSQGSRSESQATSKRSSATDRPPQPSQGSRSGPRATSSSKNSASNQTRSQPRQGSKSSKSPTTPCQAKPITLEAARPGPHTLGPPRLSSSAIPSSQLWPIPHGREVLDQLSQLGHPSAEQLKPEFCPADGQWLIRTEAWTLQTSIGQRFPDLAGAREFMRRNARLNTELGPLLPTASILVIQEDQHKNAWVWSVKPTLPTLSQFIQHAKDHTDRPGVTRALRHYAKAVITVVSMILRRGYPLRVTPNAFGVQDGRVVYIAHQGTDTGEPTELLNLATSLLREVDLHRNWTAAVSAYVNALDHAIRKQLHADEIQTLDLVNQFSSTKVRSTTADIARRRLLRAARSCSSSPNSPPQYVGSPR